MRPPYGRLLEFYRSKLRLLQMTTFHAKNFMRRLSRSISSQWLLSPKFEVEIGRNRPTFGLKPLPLLRAPFLSCLHSMAPSAPFLSPFSLLCFPMLYPPFPPPVLVPSSPASRGAPHPARRSSQLSSVSSPPSKSGRSPADKMVCELHFEVKTAILVIAINTSVQCAYSLHRCKKHFFTFFNSCHVFTFFNVFLIFCSTFFLFKKRVLKIPLKAS